MSRLGLGTVKCLSAGAVVRSKVDWSIGAKNVAMLVNVGDDPVSDTRMVTVGIEANVRTEPAKETVSVANDADNHLVGGEHCSVEFVLILDEFSVFA